MIAITNHAYAHWIGRCNKYIPGPMVRSYQEARMIDAAENGRMATRSELNALTLWLTRGTSYCPTMLINHDSFVVNAVEDVAFVLAYEDNPPRAVITSVIPLSEAIRQSVALRRHWKECRERRREWRRLRREDRQAIARN